MLRPDERYEPERTSTINSKEPKQHKCNVTSPRGRSDGINQQLTKEAPQSNINNNNNNNSKIIINNNNRNSSSNNNYEDNDNDDGDDVDNCGNFSCNKATSAKEKHFNDNRHNESENGAAAAGDGGTINNRKRSANISYDRTADFFNNIPDFVGDAFPPFIFGAQRSDGQSETTKSSSSGSSNTSQRHNRCSPTNSTDVLRVCEDFLFRHRIRSDFFCQYHKAISSTVTPSTPAQEQIKSKAINGQSNGHSNSNSNHISNVKNAKCEEKCKNAESSDVAAKVDLVKNTPTPREKVERFTKLTAIYTLPVIKKKKKKERNDGLAKNLTDASSSNEAVHLQQRLKSLSTELVTLRNRLHVGQGQNSVTNGTNGGTTTATSTTQRGPIASALNLNASSPNLNSTSANNAAIITSATAAIINGNATQTQQHHANIIPTLNNHSNAASLTSSNNNVTNIHTANHGISNKNAHTFNQMLQHSGVQENKIISSRNTSIPHPLPHQIDEKHHTYIDPDASHNIIPTSLSHHNANTLPMRHSNQHSYLHQQHQNGHPELPFIPAKNYANPCHSVNTLPFGFSNSNTFPLRSGGGRYNNSLSNIHGSVGAKQPYEIEDLIHLPGPLTEHAVMRTLQARFNQNRYFTNVGPILLSINPYLDVGNPLTLSSTRSLPLAPQLRKVVQEAVRQQAETGYPQAIILSGTSGAGKTHCSMLLLRQLFAVAGGGPETDAFKHLAAAFTVLRSLGSAKTTTNSESSRIGQFIEVQVTDSALYRTKIHCYFLDQTRVIRPLPREKNYHIFYQMLAGLNREERIKLNLEGYSSANLRYMQCGDISQNEQEDAARFQAWKTCLGILGIPFLDVVRVLSAVLLLGNVQFIDGQGLEVDVKGETELNSVASLLGVPPAALFRGLTTRTHNARGQLVKSVCDANMSNMTRDCLAKALYCRTVATIVRRANSLKRLGSTLGTLSSDSNESVHNQADVASQHASTIGGNSGSKSMAVLNNAVRHATDGFIGILDMFGFEEPAPHAQLEHLCINLCAETMQHFYNTHIFKSSVESCRDEGIACDTEVDYVDNVPCIDLISSLRTGLLSMLDAECSVRGTAESYVAKIKVQHRNSTRLEAKHTAEPLNPRMFAIRHFAGRVEYDATDFLDTNRDVVPDDLVAVFYKHTCNFGFATHLFGSELKALYALPNAPRGLSFRIAPTSHTDLLNGDEPVSTLTQDFHTRLDNLLRTLVHARPHFVRCIRSNSMESCGFERSIVVKQIRALQVLETVNLMASGFPHRMRFKQFNARYRMLAPFRLLRRIEEKAIEDCNLILQYAMENPPLVDGSVTLAWAPGKRHVFLSEGIRQHLEHLRTEIRNKSATLIQATWRGWQWRRKMSGNKRNRNTGGTSNAIVPHGSGVKLIKNANNYNNNSNNNVGHATTGVPRLSSKTTNLSTVTRPRPQPIAGTPPPDPTEKCDSKIIQQTCSLFGLDLERPPPVPLSRAYTITGSSKLGYPQSRIMKMNFPEDSVTNPPSTSEQQLKKGETVTVVGASPSCRGHLLVEHKGQTYHVPFQYMELVRGTATTTTTTTTASASPNASTIVNKCNSKSNSAINVNTTANSCNNNNNNNNNKLTNNTNNNNNNTTTSAAVKI